MTRIPDESPLTPRGEFDERLDANLGRLLAPDADAAAACKEVLQLAAGLVADCSAVLGVAQAVAFVAGLPWQKQRSERVKELFLGLYERGEETRRQYVSKGDFPDLLFEALRRMAEQPDTNRRTMVRSVFLKILERPGSHLQNRLFLRLADELPAPALEGLLILADPQKAGPRMREARITTEELDNRLTYLAHDNLAYVGRIDLHSANIERSLRHVLTPMGLAFVDFIRE